LIATDGRNLHGNGLSDRICSVIKREMERRGDPYATAKGGEGAAADVAVSGLLERRRLLHGLGSRGGGSGPELLLLGPLRFADLRRRLMGRRDGSRNSETGREKGVDGVVW
jgi:hypothetical protein